MPTGNNNPERTLFEQIQQLQERLGQNFESFTNEDEEDLNIYSMVSRAGNYQKKYSEDIDQPDNAHLKQISKRLGALAAHYPKNSPELATLREQIPNIGNLRKAKMEALRTDAGRSGMDKLLNDFFGSKKRAAKDELKRMQQSRKSIDGRDRSNAVKAPAHPGKGRNIFTAITNASGLGSHEQRHNGAVEFSEYGKPISFRTRNGVLSGVEVSPAQPSGKVVLVFSGSGNPAEHVLEAISDSYSDVGATVIAFNYRGFGESKTLDSNGKQIGTPLSEQSLYEDGMEMYKYVRDVMGVSPENIILHGYSLGGAVASHVAANVAEQNNLKGNIPDSKKLGGVVLQSPIETMYSAAKNLTHSSIAAFFGSKGSGAYNTRENMQRLYQNDPSIPVVYISGTEDSKDHLSLEITNLHADPKAPFQNASVSFTDSAHHEVGDMLMSANEHLHLATDGRNVQLNTNSIQRQGNAPVQEQGERAPMEL